MDGGTVGGGQLPSVFVGGQGRVERLVKSVAQLGMGLPWLETDVNRQPVDELWVEANIACCRLQ